ncbi:hypothetical protein CVT24_007513, partial [Panaeolus cyanescens]
NQQKLALNLSHLKATHAGRGYSATNAVTYGASSEDVRALGIWSQPGSFSIYNRALPVNAMIASAGCNGNRQESYFIAREILEPPHELVSALFPWVESEQQAYNARLSAEGSKAQDESLRCLLELLIYLRRVLLQDAAILFQEFPDAPIFSFFPFNTPLFREFSATSFTIIHEAEELTRHRLQKHEIQETYATMFKGFMETILLRIDQQQATVDRTSQQILHRLLALENRFSISCQIQADATGSRKRKAAFEELSLPVSSPSFEPEVVYRPSTKVPRLGTHTHSHPSHLDNHNHNTLSHAVQPGDVISTTIHPPTSSLTFSSPASQSASADTSPMLPRSPPGFFYSRKGNIYSFTTFPVNPTHPGNYDAQLQALVVLEDQVAPEILKCY